MSVSSKVLYAISLLFCLCHYCSGQVADQGIDYQKMAEGAEWGWSPLLATPLGCLGLSGAYEVRLISNAADRSRVEIEFWSEGHCAYRWNGHLSSVFLVRDDKLFYADFMTGTSGGNIIAIDLKTGKQLWRSPLKALGPVEHSNYNNLINLNGNQDIIEIFGLESAGRYIEIKRLATGETLAHRIFPPTGGADSK